jgi:hypothetical protein
LGGKSHEFIVQLLGVLAGQEAVTDHGVFIDPDEAAGLANPDSFDNVVEDIDNLVLRQTRVKEGCPFAFRETYLASPAPQQAALLATIAHRHGEIAVPAFAMVGTCFIEAAET